MLLKWNLEGLAWAYLALRWTKKKAETDYLPQILDLDFDQVDFEGHQEQQIEECVALGAQISSGTPPQASGIFASSLEFAPTNRSQSLISNTSLCKFKIFIKCVNFAVRKV